MEPWEALDLDDSDLPSILRPCKRHQSQQSQLYPDSLSNPNFSSQHRPPTPPPPTDYQPPPPSRCPIPGPAGAMQAIMGRIGHRNEDFSRNGDAKISTQDYIKMVEEDDAEEFTSDHWLSAMDFLSREGAIRTTSLNDVKNFVNNEKIDMIVAMIKSCTPNGLGDMTVVLKDPTDTISASIHRKVLTEGDYGKQIAVGSILILQQVSVFSPLNKSFYLNISLSNVLKVVPKDAGREIYSECHKSSKMAEQVLSGSGRTTKASELNFNSSASGSQMNAYRNSNMFASLQQLFRRDNAAGSNSMKEPIEADLASSSQEEVTLGDERLFEKLERDDLGGVERLNGSKASLQQWTDDQLDILDMDDE